MQNNCVKFGKVSLLQGFIFFPSLAEGEKWGGLKARNVSDTKCLNDESTHPPSSLRKRGGIRFYNSNTNPQNLG